MSDERTPPKRIRISGLQEAHLPALAEIEQVTTAMYYERGFDAAEVPVRSVADITRLTRNHNVRVAEADHDVAGYTAWRDEAPGIAYVEELSVHPQFQRFGVGSCLMEKIRDEARDLGLKQVVLRCWTNAPWAMEFYKSAGFTPIDESAPEKVLEWKEMRSEGRPLTRPGEIAMWTLVG
jgi:N-acetylglutamate synthase-like GNAT family acetyltransferase